MPFIENIAKYMVPTGDHNDPGENSMLIQIMDPAGTFPEPKFKFKEVHQFEFLDIEENDTCFDEGWRVSDEQATELVRLLQRALDTNMNVIVHCHMGICRSGAVVEVGVMMGFEGTERFRQPNLLVKHKMMRVLGLTYDVNENDDPEFWRNANFNS